MFKRFLAGLAALSAGPALAADLPSIKAPLAPELPPADAADWSGFYLGLDLGGAWAQGRYTFPGAVNVKSSSVMGGGFVGFNRQFGSVVVGLEGDVQGLGVDGKNGAGTLRVRQNLLAAINGRLGYAFGNVLVYAIGGVAFSDTNFRYLGTSYNDENVGYDVGGGLEYAVTPNWTVRAEYRYYDFGKVTKTPITPPLPFSFAKTDDTFRAGVAYKFGGVEAAPIIAKY